MCAHSGQGSECSVTAKLSTTACVRRLATSADTTLQRNYKFWMRGMGDVNAKGHLGPQIQHESEVLTAQARRRCYT